MTLFRDKYRIETTRKRDWNYAAAGWYFVTICTENNRSYFGHISNDVMCFSDLGQCADTFWREIPSHHKNVTIDEFIVMPNDIHGIIVIDGPEWMPPLRRKSDRRRPQPLPTVSPTVSSLAAIVRSYKSAVTTWAHEHNLKFEWQPRFHERIIRGKNSLANVRQYIQENPANWKKDTEFVRENLETERCYVSTSEVFDSTSSICSFVN